MSYLDFSAQYSYGAYNIKFAHIVGLSAAVYWNCLMNVLSRVKDKKTFDANGYFSLDRDYVQYNTTLTVEQQYAADLILSKLGILDKGADGRLRIDMSVYFSLLTEEDGQLITKISNAIRVKPTDKSMTKKEAIVSSFVAYINETDPDLRSAYTSLAEVLYAKGVCTKTQFRAYVNAIRTHCQGKSAQLAMANKAILLGYRDPKYLFGDRSSKADTATHLQEQQVSTGVNKDVEF